VAARADIRSAATDWWLIISTARPVIVTVESSMRAMPVLS
jgi:hypothetical protein